MTQRVETDSHGQLPENADSGIKNLGDLPEGTHAVWGQGAQTIVDGMKPGETKDVPATIEFPDGSTKDVTIPVYKTSTRDQGTLNLPTDKVPVDDTKHITDEDKGKVIDNVKKSNPGKDITDAHVDDDGTFHGKVDGQDVVIPGIETVVEKSTNNQKSDTNKGLISNDNSEKNSHMINANVNTKSRNSLSAKQNRLPQTGSETSGLSALGLAMLSLVGLGFLIKKRKED